MGTEIAIGLCKAAITYELGIKRPLVGTETGMWSFIINRIILGIKRPLVGTETVSTNHHMLF